MVNARVLSEEDLALHLQTRALQSTRKAAVKRVVANLKKYPQFASVVDHHFAGVLKSEGLQPVVVVSRKHKKSTSKRRAKRFSRKRKEGQDDHGWR